MEKTEKSSLNKKNHAALRKEYQAIFSDFDDFSVGYCLLRNFEFLFDSTYPWEGLDMAVCEEDFKRVQEILLRNGFTERKQQFSLRHRAYFKLIDDIKVSFDIQVGGVYWNDMKYMDESIIANRVRKDFFNVPNANDTFVMLLVHSILGKRYFKPKYQHILSQLLEQGAVNELFVLQQLSFIFTKSTAKKLLELVKVKQFRRIPISYLLSLFILKNPKNSITLARLTFRWIRWKRPLRPYPLISIVGPDGAGKSTLVKSLHGYLQENKRNPVMVYLGRGRDHILPFMAIGRKYKSAEKKRDAGEFTNEFTNHNASRHVPFTRSLLYTASSFLFVSDLLLRYWLTVFPLRMRKKIVITDRYCTDIILMKNVPFWWKKLLYSLFPKPTISILLYNTPEILHQRRPAETIQELQRQMNIFNRLSYHLRLETQNLERDNRALLNFVMAKLLLDWY